MLYSFCVIIAQCDVLIFLEGLNMKELLDKKMKPRAESSRTEVSRIAMFKGSDQSEWSRLSKEVELKLSHMFSANNNISVMCDYAKDQRKEIAKQLKHQGKFGVPREKRFLDIYNDNYFAGGDPNRRALIRMKEILLQNGAADRGAELLDDDEFKLRSNHKHSTIVRNIPLRSYTTTKISSDAVSVQLYTQGNDENEKITILCRWPEIYKWYYDPALNRMESIRQQLFNKTCQGDEALLLLGLLAYELSNIVLYKRGSAAITGWIIRAIAKEKGFNLDMALQVNDLPFDICAQVHSRESYALDFADSLIKEFDLDAPNCAMRAELNKKVKSSKILQFNCVFPSYYNNFMDPSKSNREKMELLKKICRQLQIESDEHLVDIIIRSKQLPLLNLLLESADFLTQKQVETIKFCQNLLEIAVKIIPKEAEKQHFKIDYEMTENGTLNMKMVGASYSKSGYMQSHDLDTQRRKVEEFIYETFGWADFNFDNYYEQKKLTIPFEEILMPKISKPYEKSPLKLLSIFESKASSSSSPSSSGEKTLENKQEKDPKGKEPEESEDQQTHSPKL